MLSQGGFFGQMNGMPDVESCSTWWLPRETPRGAGTAAHALSRARETNSYQHFADINYVNGVQEGAADIHFTPQKPGRSAIGVRINLVDYFKGAIHLARFTIRPLAPSEFLRVPTRPR